jgi:putative ABC transport system ATP-binding protein
MPVLEARALAKAYRMGERSVDALAGVDFNVEKGEFVAIMGPSGSGKSTLLHLIGGLDRPSGGEVALAGQALASLNDTAITLLRRRNIGFVFQFYNLLPTLTAEENICLPLLIDGKDVGPYEERLTRLLGLVGLEGRRQHKPEQLSGGEQQRVALVRALITEPAILLADEPTGNLDSKTGLVIMALLRRLCDELEQTIVLVTHDPRTASYADRVVFLRDGQIVRELHLAGGASTTESLSLIVETMQALEVDTGLPTDAPDEMPVGDGSPG